MSNASHRREGLGRLSSELSFIDDVGPGIYRDYHDLAVIEELEYRDVPDDQSSVGFLDAGILRIHGRP